MKAERGAEHADLKLVYDSHTYAGIREGIRRKRGNVYKSCNSLARGLSVT